MRSDLPRAAVLLVLPVLLGGGAGGIAVVAGSAEVAAGLGFLLFFMCGIFVAATVITTPYLAWRLPREPVTPSDVQEHFGRLFRPALVLALFGGGVALGAYSDTATPALIAGLAGLGGVALWAIDSRSSTT